MRLKLIVNLVLGLNRAVLAEGLALAAACRIDAATALKVLQATPAYLAIMDSKGPKMVAAGYLAGSGLSQHLKDVRLIRALAIQHHGMTPLSEVHEALLEAAVKLGYGDADRLAIIELFADHLRSAASHCRRSAMPIAAWLGSDCRTIVFVKKRNSPAAATVLAR